MTWHMKRFFSAVDLHNQVGHQDLSSVYDNLKHLGLPRVELIV